MITINGIEPIQLDHNVLYCVGYSRDIPDMIHYTNIELAQVLRYIARTRPMKGVKVWTDEVTTMHVVDYLEENIETLLTEIIENDKAN